ncbi:hypothetical protein BH10BAC3_BH10BAC3_20570 [soil metagenome]
MEKDYAKYNFDYKPGRTVEELEQERLLASLNRTPTERFRIMMQLIRISEKTQNAVIQLTPNY